MAGIATLQAAILIALIFQNKYWSPIKNASLIVEIGRLVTLIALAIGIVVAASIAMEGRAKANKAEIIVMSLSLAWGLLALVVRSFREQLESVGRASEATLPPRVHAMLRFVFIQLVPIGFALGVALWSFTH